MEHRIYLGSDLVFTNPERVVQAFELNVGSVPCDCAFDSELQQFEVRCNPEHVSQLTEGLVNAVRSVSVEIDADQGVSLSTHGPRFLVGNGHCFDTMEQIYQAVDEREKNRPCANDCLQQPLILHQNIKMTWLSKLKKDRLETVFSDAVLNLIENTTHSRIDRKSNEFAIATDSEEAASAVSRKLEVLQELYLLSRNAPSFDFYDDGREIEYHLRFRRPRVIIDYELASRKDFPIMYNELVCVKWDEDVKHHKAYFNRPAPLEGQNNSGVSFWGDDLSFSFGQNELCLTEELFCRRDVPSGAALPVIQRADQVPIHPANHAPSDQGGLATDNPSDSAIRFIHTRRVLRNHSTHKPTSNVIDIDASMSKAVSNQEPSIDSTELDPNDNNVLEALQANDETNTRRLRNIHALLAPRIERKTKPEIDLSKNLIPALEEILKVARAQYSSSVILEVSVGKFYISTETIDESLRSDKSRILGQPFRPSHWSRVFRTLKRLGKATTIFSPRLGTSCEDANNLLSLKDNSSVRIFEPFEDCTEGSLNRVDRFHICCRNHRTGEQVLIVLNANNKVAIQGKWGTLGDVNLHFPKQAWDACFRMKSARCLKANQTPLYEATVRNLCVRIQSHDELGAFSLDKTPVLSTKTGNREIIVESVELRRQLTVKTNSAVVDGLRVSLTQVHRLKIERRSKDEYVAWLVPTKDRDNTEWHWWEMKMSSDGVDKMFDMENPKMEIGDIASYDSWVAHKESIKKLIGLARLIVPKMDSIGASTEAVCQSSVAGMPKERSVDFSAGRSSQ